MAALGMPMTLPGFMPPPSATRSISVRFAEGMSRGLAIIGLTAAVLAMFRPDGLGVGVAVVVTGGKGVWVTGAPGGDATMVW